MKPNVTLAAVLIAAVLGGGYWYWEIKAKPIREQAAEDAKRLFPGLNADFTSEILLRADPKPQVLLRKVDGAWHLIAPVQSLADEQAVDALLTQLKSVKREEVVDEKGGDLRQYGLDKPSGAVTFKPVSGEAQVLFFGADSFDGTKAYALVNGHPQVFLTGLAAKTALLKDANGLRDKRLLPFDPSQLVSIKSSAGSGFTLEKDKQGYWQVRAGTRLEPADVLRVDAWIAALRALKGDQVVDEDVKNPAKYQLGSSKLELQIAGAPPLVLQKGGLQGKGPAFFARIQALPQVWAVNGQSAAVFAMGGTSLMDMRAFDLSAGEVDHFVLWQDGNSITARRSKDLKWSWDSGAKADPAFSLEDFLAKVSGTSRLKHLPDSARPAKPVMVLTFYDKQDLMLEQAVVGPKQAGGQVAQSAVKKMLMIVPDNVFVGLPQPAKK